MWCEGSKIFMVIVVKIKLYDDKMMIVGRNRQNGFLNQNFTNMNKIFKMGNVNVIIYN